MTNRMTAIATLVLVFQSLDLSASVVLTTTMSTTADGKTTTAQVVESIHDQMMGVHVIRPGDPGRLYVYDMGGSRVVILDRSKQEAETYDAVKAAAEVERRFPRDRITSQFTPTGRTKDLLGVRCEEYTFVVKAPLADEVLLLRSGTAWVAKQGAGVEEYLAFYRSASTVLTAGSIKTPKSLLAVARTDTELYQRIAALGGMPYEIEMKLTVEGSGFSARLLRKSLAWSRLITTTAVDTAPLQQQMFAIPEGWKAKPTGYDRDNRD